MTKSIFAAALLLAPLFACSAESAGDDTADTATDSIESKLEEGSADRSVELADACGKVTLDYCDQPGDGTPLITAFCHTQHTCKCDDAQTSCAHLVKRYCGHVDRIGVVCK